MPTASKDVVIRNKQGLHARPVMMFVEMANRFRSEVQIEKRGSTLVRADGKSTMQLITLEAPVGTKLRITADGEDAEAAVATLAALVDRGFEDDEPAP
jgi:phosphotransferase system HPr (HPr) family protein